MYTYTNILPGASVNWAHSINYGLIGLWPMVGYSAKVADMSASARYPGTLTGAPVWSGGKYGSALAFDGTTDQYVNFGNVRNFGTADFTMSATYMTRSIAGTVGTTAYHIAVGRDFDTGVRDWTFGFSATTIDRISFNDAHALGTHVDWVGPIVVNTWYNVVVTRRATAATTATMSLYVNGVLVNTANTQNGITDFNGANNVFVGKRESALEQHWLGLISEVAMWSRALTASEVSLRFNNPAINFVWSQKYRWYVPVATSNAALRRNSSLSGIGASGPFSHDPLSV